MKKHTTNIIIASAFYCFTLIYTTEAACASGTQCVDYNKADVVSTIRDLAPAYDVPAWFALRIARVESNYNPRARGSQGEYGVFQVKCDTARVIGYDGPCGRLLDAETNIRVGLKHLELAIKRSKGNRRSRKLQPQCILSAINNQLAISRSLELLTRPPPQLRLG